MSASDFLDALSSRVDVLPHLIQYVNDHVVSYLHSGAFQVYGVRLDFVLKLSLFED